MTKQVLNKTEMETKTTFHQNGSVDIKPKSSERGKKVTVDGKAKYEHGRIIILPSGKCTFVPSVKGTGPQFKELFDAPYCTLKMYKTRLVLTASVPLEKKNVIDELECAVDQCLPSNTSDDVIEEIEKASEALRKGKKE